MMNVSKEEDRNRGGLFPESSRDNNDNMSCSCSSLVIPVKTYRKEPEKLTGAYWADFENPAIKGISPPYIPAGRSAKEGTSQKIAWAGL